MSPRALAIVLAAVLVATIACGCAGQRKLTELQRVKSGGLDVVLLADHDAVRHGKDVFTIEFRSTPGGGLVDVGNVKAGATMPMPGMPMFGSLDVQRTTEVGRYTASSDLGMAGSWRLKIDWDGPAGRGSVEFARTVQ